MCYMRRPEGGRNAIQDADAKAPNTIVLIHGLWLTAPSSSERGGQ
jgi:hypothetical protein